MSKCQYCVGGVVNKLTLDIIGNFSNTREVCNECNGTGFIKQTNADKIRSMSDEELAEFIQDIWSDNHGKFVDKLLSKSANPICILEMLKSEVEK